MKTALITGATSGIGNATAIALANLGIQLVICGRRQERLTELKSLLRKKVAVHTLCFDVQDKKQVFEQIARIPANFSIDILINNAGNAHGLSPIQDGDLEDWDAMIDSNVKGLLYVSKALMPHMISRGSGHIINIGSIAGKEIYPNGNVYCASKHAVDAITKSMLVDLNPHGIRVGAIHPGAVATEFSTIRFKGDTQKADSVYHGFEPLSAEDVADIIAFVVTRPYHVNIADLLVLPTAQGNAVTIHREK